MNTFDKLETIIKDIYVDLGSTVNEAERLAKEFINSSKTDIEDFFAGKMTLAELKEKMKTLSNDASFIISVIAVIKTIIEFA